MSLKDHPQFNRVITEVNAGRMSISKGASELGASYKPFWDLVQTGITDLAKSTDKHDDITILRDLMLKVKDKTEAMLTKFDEGDKRIIPLYVREVRQLIVDVNRIALEQLGSPKIIIQNFMIQQVQMQTFLLEELCDECKDKLLNYLETAQETTAKIIS